MDVALIIAQEKKILDCLLNSVLNCSGVNNFNYSVSVHYSFIYSCIHCLYLIITLLVINGHVGMESIPVCIGQKEGKPQLILSIEANHC